MTDGAAPPPASPPVPAWMTWTLRAAAVYNITWGTLVILWPALLFWLVNAPPEQSPNAAGLALWQCVGMVIGLYGVGYWIASRDPMRHWPIVLVGLLGKILGPIGFVGTALVNPVLPTAFGYTLITNDFIWWWPFGAILLAARRHHQHHHRAGAH